MGGWGGGLGGASPCSAPQASGGFRSQTAKDVECMVLLWDERKGDHVVSDGILKNLIRAHPNRARHPTGGLAAISGGARTHLFPE